MELAAVPADRAAPVTVPLQLRRATAVRLPAVLLAAARLHHRGRQLHHPRLPDDQAGEPGDADRARSSSPCCSCWSAAWASSPPAGAGPTTSRASTSGASAAATSAAGSPGSWSAATSTPPTPSWPCPRWCSAPARSASSRVPYTVVIYPMVFLVLTRLWSVSHVHGFVTPADFVRARFGSPTLALLVAITGHRGDDAVHRAAARRHRGGAEDDGDHRASADHHRVRHPGGVHLSVGAAGAGADRVRQGHAHLHRDPGRRDLHPDPAGRLGVDLRRRQGEVRRLAVAERRAHPEREQPAAVHHAGVRLGPGALPVPAQPHRRAGVQEPRT